MFAKNSRYRPLPDVVTLDIKGRTLPAKSARLLPAVTGTFLHTVKADDRLDQLAFQYYQQPRKWWRICDANPAFLSPQDLLGKELLVTARFPGESTAVDTRPPWTDLVRGLMDQVGVVDVQVSEEMRLVNDSEYYDRSLLVTFNPININANDLMTLIGQAGFEVLAPTWVGRVGKQIVIPPNVVG
jgi:hypothetical protein